MWTSGIAQCHLYLMISVAILCFLFRLTREVLLAFDKAMIMAYLSDGRSVLAHWFFWAWRYFGKEISWSSRVHNGAISGR